MNKNEKRDFIFKVIDLIDNMAVPIIKNAMIVKALELKSTYKSHILEYEQEKARESTGCVW